MDLSIIILNYKSRGLLKQCLKGLLQLRLSIATEIIVIDNHSNDGTDDMMPTEFVSLRYIRSPKNVGFAAGNNLGIREASGRYLLIMNPDIAVFGNVFERMVTFLDQHPSVGICGPKLLNPDGSVQTSCRTFPTVRTILYRRSPLGKLPSAREDLRRFLMTEWDHNDNRPVDWLLGACVLVRRSAMEKVGLLDERFFLYFEDVDWCRRFWQAGYEVWYLGQSAELVHYHRQLSAESPGLSGVFSYATRLHIRSGIRYFLKYRGKPTSRAQKE